MEALQVKTAVYVYFCCATLRVFHWAKQHRLKLTHQQQYICGKFALPLSEHIRKIDKEGNNQKGPLALTIQIQMILRPTFTIYLEGQYSMFPCLVSSRIRQIGMCAWKKMRDRQMLASLTTCLPIKQSRIVRQGGCVGSEPLFVADGCESCALPLTGALM